MISRMFHPYGPSFMELLEQALSSTTRGYDLLAPRFDLTPFRTPDPLLSWVATQVGGSEKVSRGMDLCCGTGAAIKHFRPLCTDTIIGVDSSAGMLAEAYHRLGLDSPPGESAEVELVQADVLTYEPEKPCQLVTCFGAFGHILEEDEPRLVDAVHRALEPGGRFVFVTSDTPSPWDRWTWIARAFNGVMRIRNALIHPPFIMYYLTFLLPRARQLLEARGFEVEASPLPAPWERGVMVVATRG